MLNTMLTYPTSPRVEAIDRCVLTAGAARWAYEASNRDAIDAGWQAALTRNPNYFNGVVYLVDQLSVTGASLTARLLKTDFKSYLHWRLAGYPESGVLDGFGSALIRSRDGAVLLGRQRSGNVNAGLAYLPGGFIDRRDVASDGTVDIAASIARELSEETGLTANDAVPQPGYIVTRSHAQVSVAVTYVSSFDANALKARIERHIAADRNSELSDVVVVRSAGDLIGLAMPVYAQDLMRTLFERAPAAPG